MPVKYSQDFQIPVEFPDVLRDLTKEILRCQPKDINAFAYEYFAQKLRETNLNVEEETA